MIYLIIAFYFFISEYIIYKYITKIVTYSKNEKYSRYKIEHLIFENDFIYFMQIINSAIIVGLILIKSNYAVIKTNLNCNKTILHLIVVIVLILLAVVQYVLIYKINDNYFLLSLVSSILLLLIGAIICEIFILVLDILFDVIKIQSYFDNIYYEYRYIGRG